MLGGRRPRGAARGEVCDIAVGSQNSQCSKSPFKRHPMDIVTDVSTNGAAGIFSAVSGGRKRMPPAVQFWSDPAVT